VTAIVYIDESADEAQREALGKILSGEAGGPVFEILSSIVTTVHGPHDVPIEWEFDQEGRTARLAVADHFEAGEPPTISRRKRLGERVSGLRESERCRMGRSRGHGTRAHVAAER
jgi:hypothetical protein